MLSTDRCYGDRAIFVPRINAPSPKPPYSDVDRIVSAKFVEIHVFAEGRVQGVGYRDFVRRSAERFGVSGWVRNRSDGSVEARLSGPSGSVEAVLVDMRKGPPFAEVANLRIEARQDSERAIDGFKVRTTA